MGQITWDRRCLLLTNHALVMAVIAADPHGPREGDRRARRGVGTRRRVAVERPDRRRVHLAPAGGPPERLRGARADAAAPSAGRALRGWATCWRRLAPQAPAEKPEASFGHGASAPGSAEHIVACAGDSDTAMVRSHMSSTTKGVMMKRTLVSAIIASLLVFVSAGAAATYGVHYARSHGSACPSGAAASTTPDVAPAHVRAGSRRSTADTAKHHRATRRDHPLVTVRSTGATGRTTTTVRTPDGAGGVTQTPAGGTAGTGVALASRGPV